MRQGRVSVFCAAVLAIVADDEVDQCARGAVYAKLRQFTIRRYLFRGLLA